MFLIAQHKILSYINQHPDARVALLLWLKQNACKPTLFPDQPHQPYKSWPRPHGTASADGYRIAYKINTAAKAQLITWVGTDSEYEEKNRLEVKAMEKYYQDRGVELEKFASTSYFSMGGGKTTRTNKAANLTNAEAKDKLKIADLKHFATKEEYEMGLQHATKLFCSRISSEEFVDFSTLLLNVDHYERNELEWPIAENYEYVKIRMGLFKMTNADFRDIIPEESDMEQYLSGKLTFKSNLLKRIYNRVGLNFL